MARRCRPERYQDMKMEIKASAGSAREVLAIWIGISLLYFVVFGAQFAFKGVVPGGDTQTLWSNYWIAIYSIRHFKEIMWWDPTALNGWPAYYLTYHGWAAMLSPFPLLQYLFG